MFPIKVDSWTWGREKTILPGRFFHFPNLSCHSLGMQLNPISLFQTFSWHFSFGGHKKESALQV